jgi:hypothetical protein
MDEPPETTKRLTVGDLVEALALDTSTRIGPDLRGLAVAKLGLAGLDLAGLAAYPGLSALKLDLANFEGARSKATLSGALTSYWRGQLADSTPAIQGSVARQMSQVVAGLRLPSAGLAGIDPHLLSTGISGSVTGSFGNSLAESVGLIAKNFGAGLAASIRPLALLAARGFSEAWRINDERQREADRALYDMGWWMPHSAMMGFVAHVARLALAGDKLAVRNEMNEASHSREFARVVSRDWMRMPVFAARKRFFLDALADHRRGRYRVSIPTLLPHLEGIAMAAFAPDHKDPAMKAVITEVAAYDALMGDALVEVIRQLWDSKTFLTADLSDRALNRHRILHGRSTGYGAEVNSTKLFFTFDLLASLVEQQERQKVGA